jgi:hypothetical protein
MVTSGIEYTGGLFDGRFRLASFSARRYQMIDRMFPDVFVLFDSLQLE